MAGILRGRLDELASLLDADEALLHRRYPELDCGPSGVCSPSWCKPIMQAHYPNRISSGPSTNAMNQTDRIDRGRNPQENAPKPNVFPKGFRASSALVVAKYLTK